MDQFEDQLRSALQRKQPSPDFTGRVMRKVRSNSAWTEPPKQRRAPSRVTAVLAIAACICLMVGSIGYRNYRGQKAKEQVMLAVKITSSKLSVIEKKIGELNRRSIE